MTKILSGKRLFFFPDHVEGWFALLRRWTFVGANPTAFAMLQYNPLHDGFFTGSINIDGRVGAVNPAEHALDAVLIQKLGHKSTPVTGAVIVGIACVSDDAAIVQVLVLDKTHDETNSL
jgi:hypothetical protein